MDANVSPISTEVAIELAAKPIRNLIAEAKTEADFAALRDLGDDLLTAAGVR